MAVNRWGVLAESLEEPLPNATTPESEASTMPVYVEVKTRDTAVGTGPCPEFVEAFAERSLGSLPTSLWASGECSSKGSP